MRQLQTRGLSTTMQRQDNYHVKYGHTNYENTYKTVKLYYRTNDNDVNDYKGDGSGQTDFQNDNKGGKNLDDDGYNI